MQVLMLNYEYPPLGGGAGNATACLLREFSRQPGLSIDLVTASIGASRVERLSENIRIHFLDIGKQGDLHYQSCKELMVYSWKAARAGRTLLRERSYDVCHAFFGIPCGYIARRLGLPYIVSLRGSDVPFFSERFRHLDRLLFRRLSARIWKEARFVIANSAGLRELALKSTPTQNIGVIYNGVDIDLFRPAPGNDDGLRVICVGRLIPRKGISYLICALAELGETDAGLTIVGGGTQERSLRALALAEGVADRVRFAGQVAHDAMPGLYEKHNVFALPSLNEGMSNAVLEAIACGLPILVTNTGGAVELLEDGKNGFLIGMRSSSDIAAKLRLYLQAPELRLAHGRRSRQIADAMSWRNMALEYQELYEQAARDAPSGRPV